MLSIEGKFVNYDREFIGRVEIDTETGLIKKIGPATGKAELIFNQDCLIFPGFIDLHVHCREDVSGKQNYKEDFLSASEAAVNGGVVHICDMPNNPVTPVDEKSYREKSTLAKKALVDVTLYAGVGPGTSPLSFLAERSGVEESLKYLPATDKGSLHSSASGGLGRNDKKKVPYK